MENPKPNQKLRFRELVRTLSGDETKLETPFEHMPFSTTAPPRLVGPAHYITPAEVDQAYEDRRKGIDTTPVPRGPKRKPVHVANQEWNVVSVEDMEQDDQKKVTLCNGQTCMSIAVGVASLALLVSQFYGRKRRSRRTRRK